MKTKEMSLPDDLRAMRSLTASPVLHDVLDRAAAALEEKDKALQAAVDAMSKAKQWTQFVYVKSQCIDAMRAGEAS